METIDLVPLIEQLDDNIDDLEDTLDPLLKSTLADTVSKLPLLDKAHLYVVVTYAIESILFSYLRLNNVDAKQHPVFRELTRVKQYFEKIKLAESAGSTPSVKLDKAAAGRFIKHALAGNRKYDANLAQQRSVTKTAAHTRFEEISPSNNNEEGVAPRATTSRNKHSPAASHSVISQSQPEHTTKDVFSEGATTFLDAGKVQSEIGREHQDDGSEAVHDSNAPGDETKKERKKGKKERKARKREKRIAAEKTQSIQSGD